MDTIADAQRADGQIPGIVPSCGWGFNWGSGPAWDSAFILIPWYLWLYRGDTRAIETHYEGMKRYVDYCAARATDGVVSFGLGDWCHVDAKRMAPAALTSTAYWYVDTCLVARFAQFLGKRKDVRRYLKLAKEIHEGFHRAFYKGGGRYANGEQTAQACALMQGLARKPQKVLEKLEESIAAMEGRMDAGILGAKYILRVLADSDRAELAYALLASEEFPSWGHWLKMGATTLWEDWPGESSRNHIMFGDISAWMVSYLAGIRPDAAEPGFKRIVIQPCFIGDLAWAKAVHESPYGTIRSAWKRDGATIELEIEIPPNTTAQVILPGQRKKKVGSGVHRFQIAQ